MLGAGLTSAFGDFSYETTNVILPGFLAVLGVPAALLGTIEGIADATASFTKLGAGYISDRLGIRKPLVVTGYLLTPIGQALIALASGWPLILAGRMASWFGKGLRGPLRDAIVAESITPQTRGRAFGFHRALDTVGAIFGPLLGIWILSWGRVWFPNHPATAFRLVLWCTLIPGVLSALCFAFLVVDDRRQPNPHLQFGKALRSLPARFRSYLGAIGVFGAGDFSHSLLILAATQLLAPTRGTLVAAELAGMLYVLRNIVQTLGAFPIGILADHWGHGRMLRAGYVLGTVTALITAAAFLWNWTSLPFLAAIFVIAGLYVAIQEALEPALTAEFVEPSIRGVAFGALGVVNGVGKLISSVAVGLVWTTVSPAAAFGLAAVMMSIGTLWLMTLRLTTNRLLSAED